MYTHPPTALVAVLGLGAALCAHVTHVGAETQCEGKDPQASVATYLGMGLDYSTAKHICCNNHRYAERAGYQDEVGFFDKLDTTKETVFYDSVCGIPLFIAPRGRSFAAWKEESQNHGWPSFRPDELVGENVIIHDGGRMESKCGTHLGHNLPSGGRDRYCIDLVCMAGTAQPYHGANKDTVLQAVALGNGTAFDPATYQSRALDWSGQTAWWRVTPVCSADAICSIIVWIVLFVCVAVVLAHIKRQFGGGQRRQTAAAKQESGVWAAKPPDPVGPNPVTQTHSRTNRAEGVSPLQKL